MAASPAVQLPPWKHDDLAPILFQSLSAAMDQPGLKVSLGVRGEIPPPLNRAAAAVALAVAHDDTPIWTDLPSRSRAPQWLLARTGAAFVTEPSMASLALVTNPARMPRLHRFRFGDDQRPESAALLLVQVNGFAQTGAPTLLGFGGRQVNFSLEGLPGSFWADWFDQGRFHPLGVDVVFTCGDDLVALPRELRAVAPTRVGRRVQKACCRTWHGAKERSL
jgi:alpha-D-ribose 1-methylphosphonate 5-triphosphate synthase subunit PhnH